MIKRSNSFPRDLYIRVHIINEHNSWDMKLLFSRVQAHQLYEETFSGPSWNERIENSATMKLSARSMLMVVFRMRFARAFCYSICASAVPLRSHSFRDPDPCFSVTDPLWFLF